MDLQTLLNERNLSKYQLSKLSGVPKTTIMDICAGRSDMERCNAKAGAGSGLHDGGYDEAVLPL